MKNPKRPLRVGILTHYYKSENYGGNLQAYALCRVLGDLGCRAQQIRYDRSADAPFWPGSRSGGSGLKRLLRKPRQLLRALGGRITAEPGAAAGLKRRRAAMRAFNQDSIPHSPRVYTCRDLETACQDYDAFITGSDQVWHPQAVCGAYLLDFADGSRIPKFSYAASLAVDSLTAPQLERYQRSLRDYQAVSVRERDAVELVQGIAPLPVEQTLDPTLLLDSARWDEIAAGRQVEGKYLFCYFLGEDLRQRRAAEEYARENRLKLVTLPHLLGRSRKCDADFGDIRLYEVGPAEFISLVKYSEAVFTDSFHAAVFSLLYRKEFFVFERQTAGSMGSRLRSLTELFDLPQRFCHRQDMVSADYLRSLGRIDYQRPFPKFEAMRARSLEFLRDNIITAQRKSNQNES